MLFKGINGSIEISPALCYEEKLVSDCFNEMKDNLVDVYIKIDFFQLIVSSQLSLKNIRFFGNDIALSDDKNNPCLQQKAICCLNDCYTINKQKLIINNENLEKKSMFLLQSLVKNDIVQLILTNVYFINFYAIKEEIGWRYLIFSNKTSKKIIFENVTILNFFFSHGLLYDLHFTQNASQIVNDISMRNTYIGNYSSISYQFLNMFSLQKIGLFTLVSQQKKMKLNCENKVKILKLLLQPSTVPINFF